MSRIPRVVVPGLPHYVTQRGRRHQQTFFADDDYAVYLESLLAGCERTGTLILAYCLLPSQVSLLLVPSSEDGLRIAIADTHRRHARAINLREGWQGRLWQERFASFPTDARHMLSAAKHIEMGPVDAKLVAHPAEYRWSSARAHISGEQDGVIDPSPLLNAGRGWERTLLSGRDLEMAETFRLHENTGRPLGSVDFLRFVERTLGRTLIPKKRGRKKKDCPGSESTFQ